MNTKVRFALIIALALLGGAALMAVTWAAPGNAPLAPGGSPTVVAYQGEVQVGGTSYTGDGYFKFAVVNAAGSTTYWSNDGAGAGGSEPTAAVQLAVSDGLFSILLGDTTLTGMTQALTAGVFGQPDRYLRVWFSSDSITFDQLTPDTRIAAVPYALQAQEAMDAHTVDGLHASELETHYQNVVVVAKSGGDYTGVQAAIDSITDAAADNAYLVWVAPGVYSETVTMKPYVHLQGAGQKATVITSTASSGSDWPPARATLVLASDASLRDLTVGNSGTGASNTALLATAGVTRTLVADVTARALGGGTSNYVIFVSGSGTGVTLHQVTALSENGSNVNSGLTNYSGATVVLYGGSYIGRGGTHTWGIYNAGATLEADSVTALGENGSDHNRGMWSRGNATAVLYGGDYTGRGGNHTGGVENQLNSTLTALGVTALAEDGSSNNSGLNNSTGAEAVVRGGSFTARGGEFSRGILSVDNGTTLEAEGVTALGEDGSDNNYGLDSNAAALLRGGSFTGRGGTNAHGINSARDDTTLEAEGVTALGENGSDYNYGLANDIGAEAVLRGCAFTGRGGTDAHGISNSGITTTLEATLVTALGEGGSDTNHGLVNNAGMTATLHGGSCVGREGTYAFGIANSGVSTTLEVESVTTLGENGSSGGFGLYNYGGAKAVLRGGSFTGRGGTDTYGILNRESNTTLEAKGVTALAENGSSLNSGLGSIDGATADVTQSVLDGTTYSVQGSSSVTISNSRLVGGGASSSSVVCVLVTRGTTISTDGSTCP